MSNIKSFKHAGLILAGLILLTGWITLGQLLKSDCEKAEDKEFYLMSRIDNSSGIERIAAKSNLDLHRLNMEIDKVCP